MIYIPAGYFYLGSNHGNQDEHPVRKIYLDAYYIGKYEVSNREYRRFVRDTNYLVPYVPQAEAEFFNWDPLQRDYPAGRGNYPVALVSWHDADEYCRWLARRLRRKVSLPTEAQWEKAARGTKSFVYPWGNTPPQPGDGRANFASSGNKDGFKYTAPVFKFPAGRSPYGCLHMSGNISEWCLDSYDKFAYQEIGAKNPRVNRPLANWPWKVLRGGNWRDSAVFLRSSYRFAARSDQSNIRWGFRYVINLK